MKMTLNENVLLSRMFLICQLDSDDLDYYKSDTKLTS